MLELESSSLVQFKGTVWFLDWILSCVLMSCKLNACGQSSSKDHNDLYFPSTWLSSTVLHYRVHHVTGSPVNSLSQSGFIRGGAVFFFCVRLERVRFWWTIFPPDSTQLSLGLNQVEMGNWGECGGAECGGGRGWGVGENGAIVQIKASCGAGFDVSLGDMLGFYSSVSLCY